MGAGHSNGPPGTHGPRGGDRAAHSLPSPPSSSLWKAQAIVCKDPVIAAPKQQGLCTRPGQQSLPPKCSATTKPPEWLPGRGKTRFA